MAWLDHPTVDYLRLTSLSFHFSFLYSQDQLCILECIVNIGCQPVCFRYLIVEGYCWYIFLTLMWCTLGNVRSPLELSEEEWNQVFKTNLTGAWLVSKYICIRMRDAEQGGSIINISSIAGLDRGLLPGGVAYDSSKAGLNTLTKVMLIAMQLFQNIGVIPLSCFVIVWKQNNYSKTKNRNRKRKFSLQLFQR